MFILTYVMRTLYSVYSTIFRVDMILQNAVIENIHLQNSQLMHKIAFEMNNLTKRYSFTGGNVVRGDRTVMQMKSLRDHPDMSYGSNKQWN